MKKSPENETTSTHLRMDSLRLYGLIATGSVALLGAYALLRRKPKTPDDLERERRAWLEGTGRITDGTVIDVQELPPANNYHAATMLIYKYDVTSARRTSPTCGTGSISTPAAWGCTLR
jgi:hypothetical protein